MNARDDQDTLIEAALGAFRERDPASGLIRPSPAFLDLAPAACVELFARQTASRHLERALHPSGLSTTARAVLDRLPLVDRFPPN